MVARGAGGWQRGRMVWVVGGGRGDRNSRRDTGDVERDGESRRDWEGQGGHSAGTEVVETRRVGTEAAQGKDSSDRYMERTRGDRAGTEVARGRVRRQGHMEQGQRGHRARRVVAEVTQSRDRGGRDDTEEGRGGRAATGDTRQRQR